MMYFIPWVVFLFIVILSVPVAGWLDKRKLRAAYGDQSAGEGFAEFEDEEGGEFDAEEQAGEDGEPGEDEPVLEAADDFGGGNDDDDAFAGFQ